MNRRSFFTRIFGAAAALSVFQQMGLTAAQLSPLAPDPPLPVLKKGYMAVVHDAWHILVDECARLGVPLGTSHTTMPFRDNGYWLGEAVDGVILEQQFAVDLDLRGPDGVEVLRPAMRNLAERLHDAGMTRFANLGLPRGVDFAGTIDALRFLVMYDVYQDEMRYRFDILGAVDLATARVRQAARTKRDIRARLSTYSVRALPA